MSLQDLGNLGDFIGGIAIIATLIYLATQIRQNTTSIRAASRLEIASGWRTHNRQMLDPAVSRAFVVGLRAYPDMPREECNIFENLISDHAVFFQGTFALYEEGQLDRQTYEDYRTWFACQVATPGGNAYWREMSPFVVKSAAAAVNERLGRGDVPDILQLRAYSLEDGERQ